MAWEAIYEFGFPEPFAWVNTETGESRFGLAPPDLPDDLSPEAIEEWLDR